MPNISHERLLELVEYNPETGAMIWRKPTSFRVKVGSRAGSTSGTGYGQIKIDGKVYSFHCIVWLYVHGVWPNKWIDHKNGDKADNRISNLRLSTVSQNSANAKVRIDSPVGLKGVSIKRKRFLARIKCDGVCRHLGVFDTPQQAHDAYVAAAQSIFGEFARAA